MKNLLILFLFVAVMAIVTPIIVIGKFEKRWMPIDPSRNEEVAAFVPSEFPDPETGATGTDSVLRMPPVDALERMAGDPKIQEGETSVRVPVLMYHHIRPMEARFKKADRDMTVTPEAFEAQMASLYQAGYHSITPDELALAMRNGQSSLPDKPVLITFDDGFKDQLMYAVPVLKKYRLKATFFIVTRMTYLNGCMKDADLKALDDTGLFTIASHTENHVFLTRYGADKRHEEIAGSKKDLEDLLGHPVTAFAFPYGSWSPEIAKEVADAGYALGFGVRLGSLHVPSSAYQLRRIRVLDGERIVSLLERLVQGE